MKDSIFWKCDSSTVENPTVAKAWSNRGSTVQSSPKVTSLEVVTNLKVMISFKFMFLCFWPSIVLPNCHVINLWYVSESSYTCRRPNNIVTIRLDCTVLNKKVRHLKLGHNFGQDASNFVKHQLCLCDDLTSQLDLNQLELIHRTLASSVYQVQQKSVGFDRNRGSLENSRHTFVCSSDCVLIFLWIWLKSSRGSLSITLGKVHAHPAQCAELSVQLWRQGDSRQATGLIMTSRTA